MFIIFLKYYNPSFRHQKCEKITFYLHNALYNYTYFIENKIYIYLKFKYV